MATLKEDLRAFPTNTKRYQAKALWEGDHPSPFDGFLTNYLGGLVKGTTHESLGGEIMQWLAFLRSVDTETGRHRHEVLFPGLSWETLLRHVGFDDSAVDVWVRAIQTNPDVSAVEVHKKLLAAARAEEGVARAGPGAPERNVNNKPEAKVNGTNSTIDLVKRTPDEKTLRRLKRDLPEVAEKVIAGEISLNKAAIDAGFRKRKVQVEVSAEGFARAIEKHLEGGLAEFEDWLASRG